MGCENSISIDIEATERAAAIAKPTLDLSLFPNPAVDQITLTFNNDYQGTETIQLFDAWGQLILEQKTAINNGFNRVEFNLENLDSGFYYIHMRRHQNTLKFVKQSIR